MRAGGGFIRCLTGRHACAGALRRGRGDRACAKRDCGGALRVRAKTNKKAPPPPKRGEAKLAVPPLFCTGIPLMQISFRLNAARRLRLVSAHRTEGPGAPHRGLAHRTEGLAHRTEGLAHRTGGPGAPHRGAWRTAQGPGAPHRGPGAPHRGAWHTAQGGLTHRTGARRGGRVQQSGSGGNFVGRRRRACSQPVTRVLWCTAGGTTFSVMAFGQYLQKNQKAIGVF